MKTFKALPDVDWQFDAPVLRTDFSDQPAWVSICADMTKPSEGFEAHLQFIDDPDFGGMTIEDITASLTETSPPFIFIVDKETLTHPEHPILVVDLVADVGRFFRVIPGKMWVIENNLTTANKLFDEFADEVGPDGIYR